MRPFSHLSSFTSYSSLSRHSSWINLYLVVSEVRLFMLIHWIMIYPLDSIIHPCNNGAQELRLTTWCLQSLTIQIRKKIKTTRLQMWFVSSIVLLEPVKDSFGATTVSNLMYDSSVFWLHTVFAIIYTVLMVIVLRHFTNLFAFKSHDDSKKTIMMTNVPKNVTADLIMQHFRWEL